MTNIFRQSINMNKHNDFSMREYAIVNLACEKYGFYRSNQQIYTVWLCDLLRVVTKQI